MSSSQRAAFKSFLSTLEQDLAVRRTKDLREYLAAFPNVDAESIALEVLGRRDFLGEAAANTDPTLAEALLSA